MRRSLSARPSSTQGRNSERSGVAGSTTTLIGNGVTGTSVLALTSWLALCAMWAGAMLTDLVVDQRGGALQPASNR